MQCNVWDIRRKLSPHFAWKSRPEIKPTRKKTRLHKAVLLLDIYLFNLNMCSLSVRLATLFPTSLHSTFLAANRPDSGWTHHARKMHENKTGMSRCQENSLNTWLFSWKYPSKNQHIQQTGKTLPDTDSRPWAPWQCRGRGSPPGSFAGWRHWGDR